MRHSVEQMMENHERLVDAAARLYRERGFNGVGIAEIAKAARLTHGAFYVHFDSKDALIAEATERALEALDAHLERSAAQKGNALDLFVRGYLSTRHRDGVGQGCAIVALGAEVARKRDRTRSVFTGWLVGIVTKMAETLPWRKGAQPRREAVFVLATLVGALLLARAVEDPGLSDDILRTVAARLAEAAQA